MRNKRAMTGFARGENDDQLERRGIVAADSNRRGFRTTVATKRVVVTVERPRADWHVEEIDELPVTEIDVGEAEKFANGWRNIVLRQRATVAIRRSIRWGLPWKISMSSAGGEASTNRASPLMPRDRP